MTDIMLDLETLGNGSNAVIIAIGAVKFNFSTPDLGEEYYQLIHPTSCTDAGLTMDAGTVLWWLKQTGEARAAFADESRMHPLKEVLQDFRYWLGDSYPRIWGNGADFDNVILGNAYRAIGEAQPWRYHDNRCYRTLAALRRDIPRDRMGTHHNALDDAKTQAMHAIVIKGAMS